MFAAGTIRTMGKAHESAYRPQQPGHRECADPIGRPDMNHEPPDFQQGRWRLFKNVAALRQAASEKILDAADEAIRERGQFLLVLAGGDTPRDVYRTLASARANWASWHIYFGDERCLPPDDPSRNSIMAGEAWLDHVPIPAAQIHPIPAELGAGPAAAAYAKTLQAVGEFDLVLLGLGEDGHTASLFPEHAWGVSPGSPDTLAITDAPKPPPQRVSLSASRLCRSRQVVFLVGGKAKRQAVADWRAGKNIPARAIAPPAGVEVLVEAALMSFPEPGA